jgi:hypothetical protein
MINEIFRNEWLSVTQYKLPPKTGFVFQAPAATNAESANYIVYAKGELSCFDAEGNLVVVRRAWDTTDTSAIELADVGPLTAEAGDVGAEFYCVSKLTPQPVNRNAVRLSDAQLFSPAHDTVFVACGAVLFDGQTAQAPTAIEGCTGRDLIAVGDTFFVEVWP